MEPSGHFSDSFKKPPEDITAFRLFNTRLWELRNIYDIYCFKYVLVREC